MRARLQQRLADNLAVTEDAARWAVETWAIALGLLAESEAVSGTSLRDSQRPHPTIAPPTPEEPTPFVTPQWQTPTQEQTPPRQETPQWQTPLPPVQGGVEWQTQTPPTPVQGGAQWQGTAQNQEPQWQTQPQGQAVPQNNAAWPPPVAGQAGWQMGMNDSGTGAAAVLPPQLRGFNWGALWLSWIWAIGNSTWIGLLALIPCVNLVMMVVLGVKGNEWAWQNRRWNSIEEFQAQQKVWAIVGWVLFGLSAIYYIIVIIVAATSNTHTQ
jgi:hypothetical protein